MEEDKVRKALKEDGWHDYQIDLFIRELNSIKKETKILDFVIEYLKNGITK